MEPLECELRTKILILEEELDCWRPWHCYKWNCSHHMCKVRHRKMVNIDNKLSSLYRDLHTIEGRKRMVTFLRVESSP